MHAPSFILFFLVHTITAQPFSFLSLFRTSVPPLLQSPPQHPQPLWSPCPQFPTTPLHFTFALTPYPIVPGKKLTLSATLQNYTTISYIPASTKLVLKYQILPKKPTAQHPIRRFFQKCKLWIQTRFIEPEHLYNEHEETREILAPIREKWPDVKFPLDAFTIQSLMIDLYGWDLKAARGETIQPEQISKEVVHKLQIPDYTFDIPEQLTYFAEGQIKITVMIAGDQSVFACQTVVADIAG